MQILIIRASIIYSGAFKVIAIIKVLRCYLFKGKKTLQLYK